MRKKSEEELKNSPNQGTNAFLLQGLLSLIKKIEELKDEAAGTPVGTRAEGLAYIAKFAKK